MPPSKGRDKMENFFDTPAPTAEETARELAATNARLSAELSALKRQIIAAAIAKSGYFADECAGMTVEEAMEILGK